MIREAGELIEIGREEEDGEAVFYAKVRFESVESVRRLASLLYAKVALTDFFLAPQGSPDEPPPEPLPGDPPR